MMKDKVKEADYLVIQNPDIDQRYSDICFHNNYAKLYEIKEKGIAETFIFNCQHGCVEHTYIRRKIPMLVDGKQYYDVTTAYGYGGPITRQVSNMENLLKEYYETFHHYCKENNVVSEFIRFHLFENKEVRENYYGEVGTIGPHISRDLNQPMNKNIHKSVRTSIRKAEKNGLKLSFDTTDGGMEEFLEVYNETMNRRDANDFYYFDKEFFCKLHCDLDNHFVYTKAILDEKVISSFLILFGEKYAYAFLGGTLEEYFEYEPSTFLEYYTIKWLKDKGLQYYTIGGGYDGRDGIFKYKKKFDKEGVYPFHVGKKIHDKKIYDKLIKNRMLKEGFVSDSHFFPLYRI